MRAITSPSGDRRLRKAASPSPLRFSGRRGVRLLEPVHLRVAAKPAKIAAMRPSEALAIQRERILAIAAAHGASNLRVFGSVATGADKEGSDIDLLVDIGPGISLFEYVGLQLDIQEALGVRVDLCTEEELHPRLRARILAEARPL